jgi:SEC-C motif domain protein
MPTGAPYSRCCGPVLAGERAADTAEALMRSRYTAYVLGDGDHLFRTWHPRTRTDDADPDPRVRWEGLEVLDVVGGGVEDTEGVVEFRAHWVSADDGPTRRGELHERSRFTRRAGRWVYLEPERG